MDQLKWNAPRILDVLVVLIPYSNVLQLDDMGTVKFSRSDFCSQEIEFKVAQLITQNKRLKGSNSCIILFKYFNSIFNRYHYTEQQNHGKPETENCCLAGKIEGSARSAQRKTVGSKNSY